MNSFEGRVRRVDGRPPVRYRHAMIGEDLEQRVMALPLADRVALAEVLWESIDPAVGAPPASEEKEAVAEACCRDRGLAAGTTKARSHQEVMTAARRALKCG